MSMWLRFRVFVVVYVSFDIAKWFPYRVRRGSCMVCFTAIWLHILSDWVLSNLTRKDMTSSCVMLGFILKEFCLIFSYSAWGVLLCLGVLSCVNKSYLALFKRISLPHTSSSVGFLSSRLFLIMNPLLYCCWLIVILILS